MLTALTMLRLLVARLFSVQLLEQSINYREVIEDSESGDDWEFSLGDLATSIGLVKLV